MLNVRTAILICAVFLSSVAGASAAPSMREVYRAALAVHDLGDVDLSPDGSAVVWQSSFTAMQGANDTRRRNALFVQRLNATHATRLTAGTSAGYYDEENPVWSPDGKHIAFLSDARSARQLQVYVADATGEGVRRVTKLNGNVQSLRWLPSGAALSILYIPDAHRSAGALAAGARNVGVVGTTVDEQRLATVDAAGGAVKLLTPPDTYVYEYAWSPNGSIAACTYARGNGDNNWWIAKLGTVPVSGGSIVERYAPKFQMNDPQWSPDGKRVAFIGGIMSDFGAVGGDVYVIAPGGDARDVTPAMPMSASSVHWLGNGHIAMTAHINGSIHLATIDVTSGAISTVVGGSETLRSVSYARSGGNVALVRNSFVRAPEIWAGLPAQLHQVTHINAGAPTLNGKAVSLNWSSDAYKVQGWLVYPLDYAPTRTYPMITIIHGGPSSASVPSFLNRTVAALSTRGYFVLLPNPRGSYGQGEAFTAANVKDFGYGDWRDDLAGVDAAIKAAPIDPNRLGLWGWSYGGYMGMWAETQTTRFKAIVAGAGIVNWQSYYGQNNIDQWMIPFFGASVYDDPAVYAKSSPITFIKASKTPVLILQGERDEEVPAPQAFEFWHAMETLGVPTKLVVYADEGHGPRRPANQIDILERTIAWYAKYL